MYWRFETAEEMVGIIHTLSSPEGILEHGTRVFMERQGNYFLSRLYWRQDPRVRALLLASAAQRQQLLQLSHSEDTPWHLRDIIRQTWGSEPMLRTHFGLVRLRVLFFLGRGDEALDEQAQLQDVVLLPELEEDFGSIWLKTAAILKFGGDYFKDVSGQTSTSRRHLRFLIKCDDDAFVDIDTVTADLIASAPVGLPQSHNISLS
eukprot:g3710.t1